MIAFAILTAGVLVVASLVWSTVAIRSDLRRASGDAERARSLHLLTLFAHAIAAERQDPRELLVWHPLGATARKLFPVEFAALDAAVGATFPFTTEQVQAAHARWTADWLTWERGHDADFKLKASAAEQELALSGGAALARARLDAVEREKLEVYQRRYEEYVRVSKALQALLSAR